MFTYINININKMPIHYDPLSSGTLGEDGLTPINLLWCSSGVVVLCTFVQETLPL